MCSEQVASSGHGERDLEMMPGLLHVVACSFENREGGMPLIQMAYIGLQAERPKQTPTIDSQYYFLHQPQFRPAAVKLAGKLAGSFVSRR